MRRQARVDSLAPPLVPLGSLRHLSQFAYPPGQHRDQLLHLAEPTQGREVDKIQLDAVGRVARQQFLEHREALLPHFGNQEVEAFGRDVPGARVVLLADLVLGVIEDKIGLAAQAPVGFPVGALEVDPVAGYEPDPFFAAAVAQQPQRIVAVGDELPQVAPGPIPHRVGPLHDIVAPLLCHLAVVQGHASFGDGKIDEGIHPAAGQLIHVVGEIPGSEGEFELVETGRMATVVEHENAGFVSRIREGSRIHCETSFLMKSELSDPST